MSAGPARGAHVRIRPVFPEARPHVDHGSLTYGRYTYRSRVSQTGEWMCVALASNKAYISLYAGPIGLEGLRDAASRRRTSAGAASASSVSTT